MFQMMATRVDEWGGGRKVAFFFFFFLFFWLETLWLSAPLEDFLN